MSKGRHTAQVTESSTASRSNRLGILTEMTSGTGSSLGMSTQGLGNDGLRDRSISSARAKSSGTGRMKARSSPVTGCENRSSDA